MKNKTQEPRAQDYINLLIASSVWGTAFIGIEIAIRELDVLQVTFGRVVIAFLVLLPFVLLKKQPFPKEKKTWLLLFVSAILNTALPFSLINSGQEHISSGMTALMLGFGPFFTLLLAHYMTNDEVISKFKVYSVISGFIGLVLLLGNNLIALDLKELQGQGYVLLASVCYAVSSLIIKKITGVPYLLLNLILFGIAAIVLLPFMFFLDYTFTFTLTDSTMALLYLGIFPTAVASIYRVKIVQEAGIQFMSQVSFLIPIFALIFAWPALGEIPEAISIVALFLILFGMYIRNKN